jgi:hypothetical protein
MLHDECSCKSDSIEIVQIEPSVYSKSRFYANVDAKAPASRGDLITKMFTIKTAYDRPFSSYQATHGRCV